MGIIQSASVDGSSKITNILLDKNQFLSSHKLFTIQSPIYTQKLIHDDRYFLHNNQFNVNLRSIKGNVITSYYGNTAKINDILNYKDLVITASDDNSIRIFDKLSGDQLRVLNGHSGSVNCIKLVKFKLVGWTQKVQIVSGSDDSYIKIWDLLTGNCVSTLFGHLDSVTSIVISDDKHIQSGSKDGSVIIWQPFDVKKQKNELKTNIYHNFDRFELYVKFKILELKMKSDKIININQNKNDITRHSINERIHKLIIDHDYQIKKIVLDKQNNIYTATNDKTIHMWSNNGDFNKKIKLDKGICSIDINYIGTLMAIGLESGEIILQNLKEDKIKLRYQGHKKEVTCINIGKSIEYLELYQSLINNKDKTLRFRMYLTLKLVFKKFFDSFKVDLNQN